MLLISRHYYSDFGRDGNLIICQNYVNRYTCKKSSSSSPAVQLGNVVCVKEDNMKGNMWKLGKVEELIVGKDSVVRGAVVRISRSGKPSVLLRRPLQLLYPLGVQSQMKDTLSDADVKFVGDTEVYCRFQGRTSATRCCTKKETCSSCGRRAKKEIQ